MPKLKKYKWLTMSLASMNYSGFVLIGIGIVGFLASVYYRRVVRKIGESDALYFKVGWYWIWMLFGFLISTMLIVAGVLSLFA
mgnify:CR=1 FL=1